MKLLVITPHYLPDCGPSASLYTMLCEALVQRGHEVIVIAAAPHYPSGRVSKEYRGWRAKCTIENGVEVIRVPVPSVNRANLALRLFQFVWYQVGITLAGLHQKYDVVLSSNPALQVGLPFAVLAVLYRKPAIFSVHDVYPDAGVALGVFRHRAVVAVVAWMEQFCLHHATRVRILSESFISRMKELGVPEERLELIYDWVDTDLIQPMPRETAFAREHGLQCKFVVLYAGNMGLSQGLEHVLTAAERLASHADLQFVFVGEGASRDRLIADAERRRLINVTFLPFQPRARLPEVLGTANVSLVILQRGIGFRSLPSKSFSIFASGRPLLASLDEGSDSWNVIVRSGGGLCVLPEDPDRLAEAILRLKKNPELCQKLGQNGREFALQNHSPQAAARHFERLLEEAMASRPRRRS
jgi:colanic acid biosynthesis glycosyl transferase WcaI